MDSTSVDLPSALQELIAAGLRAPPQGSWRLRNPHDAYGHRFESELAQIFTRGEMVTQGERLPQQFASDAVYGTSSTELAGPGAIPDILDFRMIIPFAISTDGAPFCLDFRGGGPPSVIWWDDVYWRRVAPSLETFLSLFDLPRPPGAR